VNGSVRGTVNGSVPGTVRYGRLSEENLIVSLVDIYAFERTLPFIGY
jgi:hypothetical protein